MKNRIFRLLEKIANRLLSKKVREKIEFDVINEMEKRRLRHDNPVGRAGRKIFSQSDEDGIIDEIMTRIGIHQGTFVEFGVGNGSECNSLALLASGWQGVWIGGQKLIFSPEPGGRLTFLHRWVTLDNVLENYRAALKALRVPDVDLLSIDLDGNDIYFLDKILAHGSRPKCIVVEINAKFPPPIRFKVDYDPNHQWLQDDYYGASISCFNDLLVENGYKCVCVNPWSGVNAFFIRTDFADKFGDVPVELCDLYVEPRLIFVANYGHKVSPKTLNRLTR